MYITYFFKKLIKQFRDSKSNEGFTFLEFIFVITLLGLTSTLVIPIFKNGINKSKQKEATQIVSSMVKGAQSEYGLNANLPKNMKSLSKFATFQKFRCNFLIC